MSVGVAQKEKKKFTMNSNKGDVLKKKKKKKGPCDMYV